MESAARAEQISIVSSTATAPSARYTIDCSPISILFRYRWYHRYSPIRLTNAGGFTEIALASWGRWMTSSFPRGRGQSTRRMHGWCNPSHSGASAQFSRVLIIDQHLYIMVSLPSLSPRFFPPSFLSKFQLYNHTLSDTTPHTHSHPPNCPPWPPPRSSSIPTTFAPVSPPASTTYQDHLASSNAHTQGPIAPTSPSRSSTSPTRRK